MPTNWPLFSGGTSQKSQFLLFQILQKSAVHIHKVKDICYIFSLLARFKLCVKLHRVCVFSLMWFRRSAPCPWLRHDRRGVARKERNLLASLLHLLHGQPVCQVPLLIPVAQSSAALLPLGPAGDPQGQVGQHHRSGQQVTQMFTLLLCVLSHRGVHPL